MSKRWYAVQAFSGYEKIVQKGLLERIAQSEISDQFGEILVPIEEVIEMKSGQKKVTERRLYPGYVLVQMEMNDDSWHLVKRMSLFIGKNVTVPNKYKKPSCLLGIEEKRIPVSYFVEQLDLHFLSPSAYFSNSQSLYYSFYYSYPGSNCSTIVLYLANYFELVFPHPGRPLIVAFAIVNSHC